MNNIINKFLIILIVATLSGCALEPGMHMQESRTPAKFFWNDVTEADMNKLQIINIDNNYFTLTDKTTKHQTVELCTAKAKDYIYKVGPRDVLSIIVWEHPELTMPAGSFRPPAEAGTLVRQDGTIFYPYIGIINVGGKSLKEIRKIIVSKLSKYLENPQIDVRIAAYRSKKAYITGEVKTPSVLPITDIPITILDAINLAGWFTPQADKSTLILTRNNKNYSLNLTAIIEEGSPLGKCLIENGDNLYFPDNLKNKVFVLGEVRNQKALLMYKNKMTLADALGDAGGVDRITSGPSKIYIIRKGINPQIFLLNADSPDALLLADKFDLQSRDIVFVSTSKITRWNRIISQMLPSVNLLDRAVDIND